MQTLYAPPLTVLETLSLMEAIGARMRYGLILDTRIRMGNETLSSCIVEGRAIRPIPEQGRIIWGDEPASEIMGPLDIRI